MTNDISFTIEQAIAVQRALRKRVGLGEEHFPLPAFIGMISDEIQHMHEAGKSDSEIAEIIKAIPGQDVGLEELGRFYAPPERRMR